MKKQTMKQIKLSFLAILFLITSSVLTSCTQISPTEAGFKISKSGDYRGISNLPLLTGYQFYNPLLSYIVTIPTTQQHVVWTKSPSEGNSGNEEITVACQGGAGFGVDVGFNYRVDPNKASQIYLKYKTGDLDRITGTYLRNIVRGSMQDISGNITVDSILNNLPAFEHAVENNLRVKLAPQGFIVDNFSITSQPRPTDPNLAASINAKIKARQDAERAKTELQTTIAEANKAIAQAQGDSARKVIEAEGEAEAVKRIQTVLSPEYVEYSKVKVWDGKLPSVIGGSGGMMLQLKQ
jgi:regulator of protease activity HflC (stomatin/prohibitin superfamily)